MSPRRVVQLLQRVEKMPRQMASLTAPQIEVLRRLDAGCSLYECNDVPRFLEEVIILSRLRVICINSDGSPDLTDAGRAYLRVCEETTGFAPLSPELRQDLPPSLPLVAVPEGPLPLEAPAQHNELRRTESAGQ